MPNIPALVTEPELADWLTQNIGGTIRDDYAAARELLTVFDLAAKDSPSLNNQHRIISSIDAASAPQTGPRWLTGPTDAKQVAAKLCEDFRITRKPDHHAQLFVDLPMPVVVSRHQCPFCRRYTRADVRQVTDHMTRCWLNPALACCKTCAHHQDVDAESDESCTHPDGPEYEDYRFPVLHCPLWETKTP
jgi:hypothetical protein